MSDRSFEDAQKIFFEYYDKLPLFKELTPDEFNVLRSKNEPNIRGRIVGVLSKGIEVTTPDTERRIRHVLSANEILDELKKIVNKRITLSNVYFHLQKLEDTGLVRIVDSLPSGRRFTAYYGRTARVFMLEDDMTMPITETILDSPGNHYFLEKLPEFISLISGVSLDTAKEVVHQAMDANSHFMTSEKEYTKQYEEWTTRFEDQIRQTDLDLIKNYFLYIKLIDYQRQVSESFHKLKELMQFPDIDEWA